MRKFLAAFCVFATLSLAGCMQPCATTGWRFEVMRPPTLNGTSVVQSSGNALGIAGLGTGAVVHEIAGVGPLTAVPAFAQPQVLMPRAGSSSAISAGPEMRIECTLEDVCRRMSLMEARLNRAVSGTRGAEFVPMPSK